MSMLPSLAVALALAVPLQEGKPGGVDTKALGKDLANKVQAKLLVANPITEVLKGWIVGNDPGASTIECWDEEPRRLRIALNASSSDDPVDAVNEQVDADVSAYGMKRLGEPIRASATSSADAIVVYSTKQASKMSAFWLRAVRVKKDFPANLLLATFHAKPGATLEEFLADIDVRKDGVKPAFDAYLAIGLRELQTWTGDKAFKLALDKLSVTKSGPSGWKRLQSADLVAGWETPAASMRLTADVLRGTLAGSGEEHRRWIEKAGGEIVGQPKLDKSTLDLFYATSEKAENRWHFLRLIEAGGFVFEVHVSGVRKDTKKLDRLPDTVRGPVEASLKSFKATPAK
jgi:hypothetical protein